jgi:ABC-type nitrate/sulfonate/bicarbonate transport system substrate-binding protein
MSKTRRTFIQLATVIPVVAGIIFASSTVGFSTDANAQASENPIKIRIAYPSGMNGQLATTMENANIAEAHGLDAEFIFFQYGPPMMEALSAGEIDTVITSLMPVTNFLSRNPGQAQVVASLGASSYSLLVPEDSDISSAPDLAGKKIAVSFGSDSHLDLLRYLQENGLDPAADVELLNVPPNELQLAFTQSFADAIVIRQPQVLNMQETFNAEVIHTWPFRFVSIMRTDFLEENPEAKDRYLAALQESVYYVATNKEQAAVWFSDLLRLDPEIIQQVSVDDPNYNVTQLDEVEVGITPEVQTMLSEWGDFALDSGMIRNEVPWGWD